MSSLFLCTSVQSIADYYKYPHYDLHALCQFQLHPHPMSDWQAIIPSQQCCHHPQSASSARGPAGTLGSISYIIRSHAESLWGGPQKKNHYSIWMHSPKFNGPASCFSCQIVIGPAPKWWDPETGPGPYGCFSLRVQRDFGAITEVALPER